MMPDNGHSKTTGFKTPHFAFLYLLLILGVSASWRSPCDFLFHEIPSRRIVKFVLSLKNDVLELVG